MRSMRIILCFFIGIYGFGTFIYADERGIGVINKSELLRISLKGKYYALVIGNNEYKYLPKLGTAVKDARDVATELEDEYGFEEVKVLSNASRDDIFNGFEYFNARIKPEDYFLIYYAGHGAFVKEADKAYWLPIDAKEENKSRWVIVDDITSMVKENAAGHVLIVSDSCYSGTMTRSFEANMSLKNERSIYLTKMVGRSSRTLMASGGNEPVSDSGGNGHSVFADVFIRSLEDEREEYFTAEELFVNAIQQSVAGRANQTPEYNPLRNSGHDGGDFVFHRASLESAENSFTKSSIERLAGINADHLTTIETIDEAMQTVHAIYNEAVEQKSNMIIEKAKEQLNKLEKGKNTLLDTLWRDELSKSNEIELTDAATIEKIMTRVNEIREEAGKVKNSGVITLADQTAQDIASRATLLIYGRTERALQIAEEKHLFDSASEAITTFITFANNNGLSESAEDSSKKLAAVDELKLDFAMRIGDTLSSLKAKEYQDEGELEKSIADIKEMKEEVCMTKSDFSATQLIEKLGKTEEYLNNKKEIVQLDAAKNKVDKYTKPLVVSGSICFGVTLVSVSLAGVFGWLSYYYKTSYTADFSAFKASESGDYEYDEYASSVNAMNMFSIAEVVMIPVAAVFLVPTIICYGLSGRSLLYQNRIDELRGFIKKYDVSISAGNDRVGLLFCLHL